MNEKKQLIINLTSQILAFGLSLFISFFITPQIITKIGVEAYGFVGLSNDFIGYAQIATVAINSMAARFITIKIHENKIEEANKFFNSVLISNIIISFFLGIIGLFVIVFLDKLVEVPTEILFDVRLLWILMFTNFVFSMITSIFSIATFAKNKLYLSSFRQIEASIIRFIILFIGIYLLPPAIWYIGLAALIFTFITSWYNFIYTKKLLPEIKLNKKYFDIKALIELISSGLWNMFNKISGILSTGLDLIISNKYVGATEMGILSIAKTIPNLILMTFGMIASVFAPNLTISYAKKNYQDMINQLKLSIKILGVFSSIPMAILFAYGTEFYQLWSPGQDAQFLQILSILTCLALAFILPLEPLWNVFTVTNKVKQSSIYLIFNSFVTIIIIFIGLNIFDDPKTKLYIIAGASTAVGIIRALTFLPIYGAKCLNLKLNTFYPPIIKNTISVIVITVIACLLKYFITINGWITLILICIITTIIALFINFILILEKSERTNLIKYLKSIIFKIKTNKILNQKGDKDEI